MREVLGEASQMGIQSNKKVPTIKENIGTTSLKTGVLRVSLISSLVYVISILNISSPPNVFATLHCQWKCVAVHTCGGLYIISTYLHCQCRHVLSAFMVCLFCSVFDLHATTRPRSRDDAFVMFSQIAVEQRLGVACHHCVWKWASYRLQAYLQKAPWKE